MNIAPKTRIHAYTPERSNAHTIIIYKYIYKQIYIYTYKYTKPSNTLTRSRFHALNTYANRHRINSPISYTHSQAQNASHLYMGKMHKPHNAPKLYSRVICTYAAILKNCIMRSVFQSCLCFVTTLKTFCNLL